MNILVYHGKHGHSYWFARNPEERGQAFLAMFKLLDECSSYYAEYDDEIPAGQRELAEWARSGLASAAERLLTLRRDNEYEGFSFETVHTP